MNIYDKFRIDYRLDLSDLRTRKTNTFLNSSKLS